MAPVTTERELRQLLTTSAVMRQTAIEDLVYNSHPVLSLIRENARVRPYYGAEIRVPLMIDTLEAQWFTGYDKLRIEPKELINSAVFTPKRVVSMFSLDGSTLMANQGRGEIIDLVSTYLDAAEEAVMDAMDEAVHADGTGNGGRSMIGLAGAIPIIANAGTYGGIDRAAHPIWRTSTFSVPGGDFPDIGTVWDSTTARPILERILMQRSKGSRHADLVIADVNSYSAISASLVAHQRIMSARVGRLGFEALEIATGAGTIAVTAAGGIGTRMPANTIYGIDTTALTMYYHPSKNFVPFHPGDGAKPINQDAIAQGIEWAGELVLSNPRFSWRLITA
jgi:hypothetical protein